MLWLDIYIYIYLLLVSTAVFQMFFLLLYNYTNSYIYPYEHMVYTEVLVEAFIRDRWALILSELVECLCIPLFGWSGSLSLSHSLYSFTFQPDFSSSLLRVSCLKIHIEYHWSKYKTESKEKKWSRERPRLAQSLELHRRGVCIRIEKLCEVF